MVAEDRFHDDLSMEKIAALEGNLHVISRRPTEGSVNKP
jgi:hypothetical protein